MVKLELKNRDIIFDFSFYLWGRFRRDGRELIFLGFGSSWFRRIRVGIRGIRFDFSFVFSVLVFV